MIEDTLVSFAKGKGSALIVTTGGTGPAPRDVTPEAIERVCHKLMPGFGEEMRRASLLEGVPTAILSRQTAGESKAIRPSGRGRANYVPGAPALSDDGPQASCSSPSLSLCRESRQR